jgi:hypothetical protein
MAEFGKMGAKSAGRQPKSSDRDTLDLTFRKGHATQFVRRSASFENLAKQDAFRGVRPNVRATDRREISLGGAHDANAANGMAFGTQLSE